MTQIVDKIKYILIFKINLQKKESNFKKKVQAIMNLINNLKNSIHFRSTIVFPSILDNPTESRRLRL
jgi:hypothetical protein